MNRTPQSKKHSSIPPSVPSSMPPSLAIALWLTGSIWLVAIIAHVFDAPFEIVFLTFVFGLLTGVAEWLAMKRSNR